MSPREPPLKGCNCRQCITGRGDTILGLPRLVCEMILCPTCGNKRCPHAEDHRNACTGSNDPGQAHPYSRGSPFKPRPWALCATHGPEEKTASGCPHCVAELRTEVRKQRDAVKRMEHRVRLWECGIAKRQALLKITKQDPSFYESQRRQIEVLQWCIADIKGCLDPEARLPSNIP